MGKKPIRAITRKSAGDYDAVLGEIVGLLDLARKAASRTVNAVMTATYWEIGRRIVELEQGGAGRADYGAQVISRLSQDLTRRFGRGFGPVNLSQMRKFHLLWPGAEIFHTPSEKSEDLIPARTRHFPLPWSHYVRLLSVKDAEARSFYESEALRAGWSVRQLDRQIATRFFERTLLSKNKTAMLRKAEKPLPPDQITPEDEIKDPYILEFLGLKDEYSESDLEEALILCAEKDSAVAHYALEGLPNKVLAAEYRMELPDEKTLVEELKRTRRQLAIRLLKGKGARR